MRTISQCLRLKDKSKMTIEEYIMMSDWVKNTARYMYEPSAYAHILGWWVLGDSSVPLSPKEAGLD